VNIELTAQLLPSMLWCSWLGEISVWKLLPEKALSEQCSWLSMLATCLPPVRNIVILQCYDVDDWVTGRASDL